MTKLTANQIQQLNSYSVYVIPPQQKLFTLKDLLNTPTVGDALTAAQTVSQSPNKTVAASYLLRRIGMFISMQFYNLTLYDEIWKGQPHELIFGAKEEFGNLAVSLFAHEEDWVEINDVDRRSTIQFILKEQCHTIIEQVRSTSPIAALTLWENIFGFLLWHYHVFLEDPSTSDIARTDLNILKDDAVWEGIAAHSLFATYLKGKEPGALLNTTVRTTCCLSKDVPGLMQCGYCPLKK